MSEEAPVHISVIIPAYNMAEYLDDAIASVLTQDFERFELIVVDDGSTDETGTVVSRYTSSEHPKYDERVRSVSQTNKGKAAAVNRGLSLARGSYVTILDADDELPPDSLSTRFAQSEDEYGRPYDMVIGAFEVFNEETRYGVRRPPEMSPEVLARRFYLRWKTPFHLNACLISQTVVNRAAPMDEGLQRCLDGDYAIRLLRVADRVQTVPSVVYRYRKHRTSRRERLQKRLNTARYRTQVISKNYYGWRKWVGVPFGLVMDAGKLGYELFVGNYKK